MRTAAIILGIVVAAIVIAACTKSTSTTTTTVGDNVAGDAGASIENSFDKGVEVTSNPVPSEADLGPNPDDLTVQ